MASTTEASESPVLAVNETCATLADAPLGFPSNCRSYRSCRSCLQKSGCAISASSRCVSQSDLTYIKSNATTDYRNALALNVSLSNTTVSNATSQSWQFPAIETTYCPVEDAVCKKCKEASFYRAGTIADSRFCVGKGGCVCIFNCEVVDAGATQTSCWVPPPSEVSSPPPLTGGAAWIAGTGDSHGAVVFILIIPIAVLLAAAAWCIVRDKRREPARTVFEPALPPQRRQVDIEPVTVGPAGWKQQREQRILSEYRQGVSNVSALPVVFQQLRSPTGGDQNRPMRGFL